MQLKLSKLCSLQLSVLAKEQILLALSFRKEPRDMKSTFIAFLSDYNTENV